MKHSEQEVVAKVESVTLRRLRLWVRRGWVAPAGGDGGPHFDELDVARIRLLCELKDEMMVNDEAMPVVLSLLDQLYGVRREMKALAQAIDRQPEGVRHKVREAYRRLNES